MTIYLDQPVKVTFFIGMSTSLTTNIALKYKTPAGTEGEFTPTVIADVNNGEVYYQAANDEFNEVGTWRLWSEVTTVDGAFPGNPFNIIVNNEGAAITNSDFVKDYLNITDFTYDSKIDYLIAFMEAEYLRIRNAPWDIYPDGSINYPAGSDVTVAEMIGYKLAAAASGFNSSYGKEVSSESLDAHSISYVDGSTALKFGYPRSITSAIKIFANGS